MNGPLPYLGPERPEPPDTSADDLYDMYIDSEIGREIDTQIMGDAEYVADNIFDANFETLSADECEGFDLQQGIADLRQLKHDIVAAAKNGTRIELTISYDTGKMFLAMLNHDAAARIAERVKKERQEAYYDRYGFDEDVPQ